MNQFEIINNLAHATGTENYYRHAFGHLVYTDGIKAMAEMCGARWLIDTVASYQQQLLEKRGVTFQVWKLEKSPSKTRPDQFILTAQPDQGQDPIVRQKIGFSDFPLDELKMYVIDGVMLLPSEY